MIRFYLGEEPILANVPTYLCDRPRPARVRPRPPGGARRQGGRPVGRLRDADRPGLDRGRARRVPRAHPRGAPQLHRAADDRAQPPPDLGRRRAARLPRRPPAVRPLRRRRRPDRPRRPHADGAPPRLARRQLVAGRRLARTPGCSPDAEPRRRVAALDGPLRRARRERHAPARRHLPRAARLADRRTARTPGTASSRCSAPRPSTSSTSTTYDQPLARPSGCCGTTATRTRSSPASRSPARTPAPCGSRSRTRCGRRSTTCSSSSAGRTGAQVSRGPHAFFEQVRNGSHLFQGTASATMVRGEPYEFIQLGLHLERAATTVRAIASRYPVAWSLPEDDPGRTQQLASLLRSCSAFEAYVKRHGLGFEPVAVAEELIRSPDQPRSVLSCLRACLDAVTRISGSDGPHVRLLGRLCADLEYGELRDPSGPGRAGRHGRAALRHLRGGRARSAGVLLEPGHHRRPSASRRHSSSNVAERRARHAVHLRRRDQRGLHRDPAQAAAPRRAALLVVRAADRAPRRPGRRVPRQLRQHGPPLRRARAARPALR